MMDARNGPGGPLVKGEPSQALRVHRVLMAWVGQKSLHFRQLQQRCIRTGMTVSPTRSKTPMEHISMQVPQSQHRRLSIHTSMARVPGAQISKFHHTVHLVPVTATVRAVA